MFIRSDTGTRESRRPRPGQFSRLHCREGSLAKRRGQSSRPRESAFQPRLPTGPVFLSARSSDKFAEGFSRHLSRRTRDSIGARARLRERRDR